MDDQSEILRIRKDLDRVRDTVYGDGNGQVGLVRKMDRQSSRLDLLEHDTTQRLAGIEKAMDRKRRQAEMTRRLVVGAALSAMGTIVTAFILRII